MRTLPEEILCPIFRTRHPLGKCIGVDAVYRAITTPASPKGYRVRMDLDTTVIFFDLTTDRWIAFRRTRMASTHLTFCCASTTYHAIPAQYTQRNGRGNLDPCMCGVATFIRDSADMPQYTYVVSLRHPGLIAFLQGRIGVYTLFALPQAFDIWMDMIESEDYPLDLSTVFYRS